MNRSRWVIIVPAIAVVAAGTITRMQSGERPARSRDRPAEQSRSSEIALGEDSAGNPSALHRVVVNQPDGPPRIATGKVDSLGHAISLSCASCHANRPANQETKQGEALKQFHQSLRFTHGSLKCVSCHNPSDYNSLRLAEGRSLPYAHVQSLCAQCHALQAGDYEHGAHGGMNGYWDLSRGPRQRKGCLDCHDPHAPAFPVMVPTFKSHDRFLRPLRSGESHE